MTYFLKKSNVKKETYLQIYESFYDPNRGHTAHRSYKALGYVHELMEQGIDDSLTLSNRILVIHTANSSVTYSHCETMRW